jgi:uncharacterized membrane protein YkvA (DUF1232 family)
MKTWRQRAEELRRHTLALYFAARDPRVPLAAKLLIALVVAYALSPIDLIPDFIPVLGYLDDLLLLPLGVWLAVKLVPEAVWQDCRARAASVSDEPPRSRTAAVIIVLVWLLAGLLVTLWLLRLAGMR